MRKQVLLTIIIVAIIVPFLWKLDLSLLGVFQYVDEIIAAFAFIYIIANFNLLSKNERKICYLTLGFLIVGLLSSIVSQLQLNLKPIMLDAFALTKCFSVFIYANHRVGNLPEEKKRYILSKIEPLVIILIITAFVCGIVNIATRFMTDEMRLGMPCFTFLCRKSSSFSNMFYIYILFLGLAYRDISKKQFMRIILWITAITWMLTMRSRSLLFAPMLIAMLYWFIVCKKTLRSKWFVVVVILAIFVVGEKIETTYNNDSKPRAILSYYGFKTMVDFFPLGSGFATYGTDMAWVYYSPLYYKYRFQYAYGLNPLDGQFAHDCYWPAIMGELGIFGVIMIIGILFFINKEIKALYREDQICYVFAVYLFACQVMASLPTSSFIHANTVYLFLFLPLMKKKTEISP